MIDINLIQQMIDDSEISKSEFLDRVAKMITEDLQAVLQEARLALMADSELQGSSPEFWRGNVMGILDVGGRVMQVLEHLEKQKAT